MISGGAGALALAWQSGRDAKAGEPDVAGVVDEHVLGLDVFVDQTALVGMAERRCQANGKAQKASQIEWLLPRPAQERGRAAHRPGRREQGSSVLRDG